MENLIDEKQKFKVYKNVFDNNTINNVWELLTHKKLLGLESPIKLGKEGNVFSAIDSKGKRIAVKIYRVTSCDFFKMRKYLEIDPRFKLKKSRKTIIEIWARREFLNLHRARKIRASVPKPIAIYKNVIAMEFIGEKNKNEMPIPAPLLKYAIPKNPKEFFNKLINNIRILYHGNVIHADLSEFNILNYNEKPVIIDLSHGLPINSNASDEMLARDIKNVSRFFRKLGLRIDEEKIIKKIKTK